MGATIYHGTPLTPEAALLQLAGRAFCVSFFRPDNVARCEEISPTLMYDNGAFSFWMQALRAGIDPADVPARDWRPYYEWLEARLFEPGRWAVVPDAPGAPSQINDGLLNEWPFGRSRGAPVWHMNGPLARLERLCERFDRVCLGWVGETKAEMDVGCHAYRRRMEEVSRLFGNRWPVIHMLRGVEVAADYPFPQRRQHVAGAEPSPLPIAAVRRNARRMAWADRVCGQA